MDQHLKYSPKNSLMARRRNNTASRMLQERLQNLEHKYDRCYKQFIRERSRVQSEMRELQDISSVFKGKIAAEVDHKETQFHNTTKDFHQEHLFWCRGFQNFKSQQKQQPVRPVKRSKTHRTPITSGNDFQDSDSNTSVTNTNNPQRKDNDNTSATNTNNPQRKDNDNTSGTNTNNSQRKDNDNTSATNTNNPQRKDNDNTSATNTNNPQRKDNDNTSATNTNNPQRKDNDIQENQSLYVYSCNTSLYQGQMTPFVSPVSAECNTSQEDPQNSELSEADNSSAANHSSKTARNERMNLESTNLVSISLQSNIPSVEVVCKFSSQSHPRFLCQHFPCVTPATYHAISRGTNGVGHATYHPNTTSKVNDPKMFPAKHAATLRSSDHKPHSTSITGSINTIDVFQNQQHKQLSTHWTRNTKNQQNQFPGSRFSPLPPDPILEHVRTGSLVPATINHARARTSVTAKLRGLNQLSSEMRAKNDKTKPQDWSINYGQQFPLRILYKPVLPR